MTMAPAEREMTTVRADWWRTFFDAEYRRLWAPMLGEERTEPELEGLDQLLGAHPLAILDLCGGDGRISRPLAAMGHHVVCADASSDMLRCCRVSDGGEAVSCVALDARTTVFGPRFDVVLNLFSSLGLFATDAEHEALIRAVADALVPGGVAIFDVVHRDFVSSVPPFQSWYTLDDGTIVLRSFAFDPVRGRTDEWVATQTTPPVEKRWSSRIFTATEIDRMLRAVDLVPDAFYGGYELDTFGVDNPRLLVVARKPSTTNTQRGAMGATVKSWRDIVDWMRCPTTGQSLTTLSAEEVQTLNAAIAASAVVRLDGQPVVAPVHAALVRADRKVAYAVRDDIPEVFTDEGIDLTAVLD